MTDRNTEHARAAMKAALASVELALSQNGAASNAIVAALASMLAGDEEKANAYIIKALDSLREARVTAIKVGDYATEAFG